MPASATTNPNVRHHNIHHIRSTAPDHCLYKARTTDDLLQTIWPNYAPFNSNAKPLQTTSIHTLHIPQKEEPLKYHTHQAAKLSPTVSQVQLADQAKPVKGAKSQRPHILLKTTKRLEKTAKYLDFSRKCRTEQHRLTITSWWHIHLFYYSTNLGLETHVQHSICLV
jgi:hypothetical protein